MTRKTPEAETFGLEELFASVQGRLKGLRNKLEAVEEQAEAGEELETITLKGTMAQVSDLVSQCAKLETKLAECRAKKADVERGGDTFDFDAARREVGCALNRIRKCCYAGDVSE